MARITDKHPLPRFIGVRRERLCDLKGCQRVLPAVPTTVAMNVGGLRVELELCTYHADQIGIGTEHFSIGGAPASHTGGEGEGV